MDEERIHGSKTEGDVGTGEERQVSEEDTSSEQGDHVHVVVFRESMSLGTLDVGEDADRQLGTVVEGHIAGGGDRVRHGQRL